MSVSVLIVLVILGIIVILGVVLVVGVRVRLGGWVVVSEVVIGVGVVGGGVGGVERGVLLLL